MLTVERTLMRVVEERISHVIQPGGMINQQVMIEPVTWRQVEQWSSVQMGRVVMMLLVGEVDVRKASGIAGRDAAAGMEMV